uniref:Origin recognition complex subunit 2 n=1 Tax=Steinernema glaseri TaxID=37863 RepID=A0A1I7YQH9_9BILA
MGKKRKHEETNGDYANDTLEETFDSPAVPKKSKRARMNESVVDDAQPDDEYEMWLVRKPVDVPIEDLGNLKFPRKFRSKMVTFESALGEQDDDGDVLQLDCEFEKAEKDIVYIPVGEGQSTKDSKKLKPSGVIGGVALISRRTKLVDKGPIKAEENFLEPDDPNAFVEPMPFEIHSIRRKPKLKLTGLKERLVAFGCRD